MYKSKMKGVLGVALTVILLASLMIGAAVTPAAAGGEAWTTVSYPRAAGLGGYIMGPTDGVTAGPGPMEMAVDGTLYAAWNVGEGTLGSNLYKSTDEGRTWSRCSTSTDGLGNVAITAIAPSPEDANIVYVTDGADVYRSSDAGGTFVKLVSPGAGVLVTCMTVGYNGGNHFVYVGDAATSDVLMMQDSFGESWASTAFNALDGTRAVDAVACSPNFATEGTPQVIAISHVTTHGAYTLDGACYASHSKGGAAWSDLTEIQAATTGSFTGDITAADIAFPADYTSAAGANDFFVGIASTIEADSDVYRIVGNTDIDTNLGVAVTSVAAAGNSGSCKLLAGTTASNDIYRSADNGTTWQKSSKKVACTSALTAKYLVMADDYLDSGKAWVATAGTGLLDEASVAQTADAGVSWNDLSMINTNINQIHNLAVSPDYASDTTFFMVTASSGAQDSVWRCAGGQWNRVFTAGDLFAAATSMVQFSPDFASDSAVFLADTATPKIYRSTNGGGWFKGQLTSPGTFDGSWIVLDSSTLIVGVGPAASITTNNGTTWSGKGLSGAAGVLSFAKSPDYANDSTLLAGDSGNGNVYRSTNGGGSWSGIPAGVAVAAGASLSVAFDADYASNSTVYAADTTSNAVYRLVIGTDTSWKRIDFGNATSWPGASTAAAAVNASRFVPGIQAAPDGALYVADATPAGAYISVAKAPIIRSVNPTASRASSRGVYFEPMTYGFAGTAANLIGVWYSAGSNTLWTLESAAGASNIWVYTDNLTAAPVLVSPADKTNTGRTTTASLSWNALPNCPRYELWYSRDSGFSAYTAVFSTTTSASVGNLSSGLTYYWKVCAAASNAATAGRALSPWSATWSVTTGIAAAEWTPFHDAANVAPSPGASGVPIRPAFQWNPADWATGYEFELSTNPGTTARGYFVEVVTSATGDNALGNTVWMCDRDLEYSTTYYWHVKAISATSKSAWGTGVFTTMAAPVVPEPPPPPPVTPEPTTPGYIWAVIGIGAALCIAVVVLIVRTRRVV